jgi:hypothetical protein
MIKNELASPAKGGQICFDNFFMILLNQHENYLAWPELF